MLDFLKLGNLFGAVMNFFRNGEEGFFEKLFKLLLALDIAL